MTVKIFGGLDIGYNETKVVTRSRQVSFASVTGTPEMSSFGFGDNDRAIILEHPFNVAIGEHAIEQSASIDARIDRNWLESDKWYTLALAAFSEMTQSTSANLGLVAGLPIAYYSDKAKVVERLTGQHTFQRRGQNRQTLTVEKMTVVPQGFGVLFAETLNDNGRVVNQALKSGRVGILDIGGKTTNLLAAHGLRMVDRESGSIDAGGWDVIGRVQSYLDCNYPGLHLNEYELIEHVVTRSVNYAGQPVDLSAIVRDATNALATRIIGQARRLWNGSARLDAILIAGGGAHLVGSALLAEFSQARLVTDNPVFSNALGFWRFAQALAGSGS